MKQQLLALVLLLGPFGALAQNPYFALQGVAAGPSGLVVSDPRSILDVDLTVQREAIVAGPYARYAQKFLGVRAPLTDKVFWSVRDASIALSDGATYADHSSPAAPEHSVVSHVTTDEGFAHIQPDKVSMAVPALEDAARNAAETIFSLRRHRLELITGEAGEHVFGQGLQAALDEIARLEQSYLELFLGKRVVSTETRRYTVYPQTDRYQYIICRFSSDDGLLPEDDLSGDMVVLQIKPSGVTESTVEAGPKDKNVVTYRVADPSVCTLLAGGREYGRTVLPLFEFGRTIRVAVPVVR